MAENDGKIYVYLTTKKPNSDTPENPEDNSKQKDKFSLKTYSAHILADTIKSEAKKSVNYAINNIGFFSGDYRLQRDVQEAISIGEAAFSAGKSFGAAFLLSGGNPLAGLVAMSANLINQGINYGLQENSAIFAIKRNNYEIEQLRNVSGLNNLKDGSRGTEN